MMNTENSYHHSASLIGVFSTEVPFVVPTSERDSLMKTNSCQHCQSFQNPQHRLAIRVLNDNVFRDTKFDLGILL